MSKQDDTDKRLKETITLGKKNKELIPQVKNWCAHIEIADVSGGVAAEAYKLPITLRVSCPHANGVYEAMNFEWNAHDFIIKHCRSCKFHTEVHETNFGRDVIHKYQEHQEKAIKAEKEEEQKKQALKEQVEVLIAKEKSKSEITELSILNLIQLIGIDGERKKVSKKIIEASKISPSFFGEIALDYLSLFFDDEEIGAMILHTTQNIFRTGKKISSFSFERLVRTIEKGRHIDETASVLKLVIEWESIDKYEPFLKKILDYLWFKRNIGEPYDNRPSYPNSISLLLDVHKQSSGLLFKLLDEKFKINDKKIRINTNFLSQDLIAANPESVISLCKTIIISLELEDDNYEDSADAITCQTLSELYRYYQEEVMDQVAKSFPILTNGAKIGFIHFFKLVLLKDDLIAKSQEYTDIIVRKLLQIIFAKETTKDLREEVLSVLQDVSKRRASILLNYFDSLIGYLVDQIKAYNTFKWYQSELEDPNGKISTFNPLQGKTYIERNLIGMEIERTIKKTESIIGYLISNDKTDNYNKIINIIPSLKSSSDGLLKSKLIAIIRRSVKEPLRLAEILPSIYNFLLDVDSKDVRYEAISFVTHLIEKHEQLVTNTLIDMIKVFMNDIDRGVKGKAIEAFGSVIKKFPNEVEEEQIQIVLKSVVNSYVVIHKRAANLAYKIFPFLNENQKFVLVSGIEALEKIYYEEKDYNYCEELVDILLFLTKENPKLYSIIVHGYISKYCNTRDYYTDVDFIKKLTFIRNQNDEFNKVWLEQCLGFLYRTNPDYHSSSFDSRKDLFATIYKIPKQVIVDQLNTIQTLVIEKIHNGHYFDVLDLYSILGYFRLYEPLLELSSYFDKTVEKNISNEFFTETNKTCGNIAEFEIKILNQQIDKTFINSLNTP